jgi:hypothetical protein
MQRLCVALAIFSLVGSAHCAELVLDFGKFALNQAPTQFLSTVTGEGRPGQWKVIADEADSPLPKLTSRAENTAARFVLAQVSRERIDEHFPLLIYQEEDFDDFSLTVDFKLVAGEMEQMAGIAFRIQDENNYYYIRASGPGQSFYFWKVVNGLRSPPIGSKVEIPNGVWQQMTIECRGTQIRALLNGREVIPRLDDNSFARGRIGFWTKSDAVSYFDDLRITYQPREILAQKLVQQAIKEYPRLEGLKVFATTSEVKGKPHLIASTDPDEIGQMAGDAETDVIERGVVYHGKTTKSVVVTFPLHDHNGEPMAAVSVFMKGFPGQTEKNAIARALPVIKLMESKVRTLDELIR